jgi:hypothetical protein
MMVGSHYELQSETGYIDARPHIRQIEETSCNAQPRRIAKVGGEESALALNSGPMATRQLIDVLCQTGTARRVKSC